MCAMAATIETIDPSIRRRVFKAGQIAFRGGRSTIDCTVRGLSDLGASLDVISTADVPGRFKLRIDSDDLSRACRVVVKRESISKWNSRESSFTKSFMSHFKAPAPWNVCVARCWETRPSPSLGCHMFRADHRLSAQTQKSARAHRRRRGEETAGLGAKCAVMAEVPLWADRMMVWGDRCRFAFWRRFGRAREGIESEQIRARIGTREFWIPHYPEQILNRC